MAATTAMALSMDWRVRILLGRARRYGRGRGSCVWPRAMAEALSAAIAGTPVSSIGEMPRNSPAMAIVLAVNWPPQAPGGARAGGGFEVL